MKTHKSLSKGKVRTKALQKESNAQTEYIKTAAWMVLGTLHAAATRLFTSAPSVYLFQSCTHITKREKEGELCRKIKVWEGQGHPRGLGGF